MSKKMILAGVAVVALGAASVPAQADTFLTNQALTGNFSATTPGPLLGGDLGAPDTNRPILPAPLNENAYTAPPTSGDPLTVTDTGASGDQFMIDVNGSPATPAIGNSGGLVPPDR